AERRVHLGARVVDPDVVGEQLHRYPGETQRRPIDLALHHGMQAVTDVVDAAAGDQHGPLVGDDRAHGLRSAERRPAADFYGGGRVAHVNDDDVRSTPDVRAAAVALHEPGPGKLADQREA